MTRSTCCATAVLLLAVPASGQERPPTEGRARDLGRGPRVEDMLFAYPVTGHYRYP